MERLTQNLAGYPKDRYFLKGDCIAHDTYIGEEVFYGYAVNLLGEYENTGVAPEEIKHLKSSSDYWENKYKEKDKEAKNLYRLLNKYLEDCREGRILQLPATVGDTIYEVTDTCDFGDDCHTKMKCVGCEDHKVEISPVIFHLRMLNDDGTLQPQFCLTYEEAEITRHRILSGEKDNM